MIMKKHFNENYIESIVWAILLSITGYSQDLMELLDTSKIIFTLIIRNEFFLTSYYSTVPNLGFDLNIGILK